METREGMKAEKKVKEEERKGRREGRRKGKRKTMEWNGHKQGMGGRIHESRFR